MPQVINTNVSALNAQRQLNRSKVGLETAMERLASGLRINSAKDDAAGLAISDRMTAQIKGMDQAVRNANDGISLAQVAEGALQESTNIIQRMRELSIQSANDSNSASDRASLQKEVNQLKLELERIATTTSFNGKNLLDGSFSSSSFHIGAFAGQSINVSINNARTSSLGTQELNSSTAATSIQNATSGTLNQVVASTMTIDGGFGSADITINNNESAESIASSINTAAEITGVTAQAVNFVLLDGFTSGDTITMSLKAINTDPVSISASISSTGDATDLANAINTAGGETGITAKLNSEKNAIMLSQSSGKDIQITDATSSSGSFNVTGVDETGAFDGTLGSAQSVGTTAASVTVGGSITFNSSRTFTISGADSVANPETSTLLSVATVDIGTRVGANDAISILDGALSLIADTRADLGAIQNRFSSTIANLENVSQNVSASRSRIQDADFAKESSNLAKNQILQQAGLSMLAQANASTQGVMSLLQG